MMMMRERKVGFIEMTAMRHRRIARDVRWGLEEPESGGEAQTLGRPAEREGWVVMGLLGEKGGLLTMMMLAARFSSLFHP